MSVSSSRTSRRARPWAAPAEDAAPGVDLLPNSSHARLAWMPYWALPPENTVGRPILIGSAAYARRRTAGKPRPRPLHRDQGAPQGHHGLARCDGGERQGVASTARPWGRGATLRVPSTARRGPSTIVTVLDLLLATKSVPAAVAAM